MFHNEQIGRLFGPEFLLTLYLAGALGGSIFFLIHKALIVPYREVANNTAREVTVDEHLLTLFLDEFFSKESC